jgi:hypothetical protein
MFLGAREQLISAFGEAGWYAPDDLSVKSALKTAQATLRKTGYDTGPVSTLLVAGRPPDLVFQKSLDTFAMRQQSAHLEAEPNLQRTGSVGWRRHP